MLLHLGKTYYALEAKTMATQELLPPPSSWDFDCDCGGGANDPPPFFHLPPPPKPPGLLGGNPLDGGAEDCNGPWTCPALALQGGGGGEDGVLSEVSPEVPVAVIIVSATMLGLFLVVAAVIFLSRLWRSYKASSKKASCDLDSSGGDLYEDLPAAPPLLAAPHHRHGGGVGSEGQPPHHSALQRYKEDMLPPPPCPGMMLPPTPSLHLYSPEPRPETPSDHLYHHISSGSETCSCSTSEAPSNALLPSPLQLVHSEEEESSSSHSYNSSSTATPTSSPTPANTNSPLPLYLCPTNSMRSPPSILPGYPTGLHYGVRKVKQHQGSHPSSLQGAVYAVNPLVDPHCKNSGIQESMVPLAQIYAPGSHLYESATLLRQNVNDNQQNCSMVHWGNIPSPLVRAVNSQPALRVNNHLDPRTAAALLPIQNTLVYPSHYIGQNGNTAHNLTCQQHPLMHPVEYNAVNASIHKHHHQHHHQHHHHHPHLHHHPTHLPIPVHTSTLLNSNKLAQSMYDVTRSPEDLTPTNSIPIDSIYNVSPHSDNLIATTCLSTVSSIPNQNEYSSTIDVINLNTQRFHPLHHPINNSHLTGISDTSSNSHPSCLTEATVVEESTSFDSSGNGSTGNSSTGASNTTLPNKRKELPLLPSRADRYRIYAHNNEQNARHNSSRRAADDNSTGGNNGNIGYENDTSNSNTTPRSVKSCDDLLNINSINNTSHKTVPDPQKPNTSHNQTNNNCLTSTSGSSQAGPRRSNSTGGEDGFKRHGLADDFGSRRSYPGHRGSSRLSEKQINNPLDGGEDDDTLYENCNET